MMADVDILTKTLTLTKMHGQPNSAYLLFVVMKRYIIKVPTLVISRLNERQLSSH